MFLNSSRLKNVQSSDELSDVYNHFLLYYGRDIPKMQNAVRSSTKKLKRIKEVDEDSKFLFYSRVWTLITPVLLQLHMYRVLHPQESTNQRKKSKRKRRRSSS